MKADMSTEEWVRIKTLLDQGDAYAGRAAPGNFGPNDLVPKAWIKAVCTELRAALARESEGREDLTESITVALDKMQDRFHAQGEVAATEDDAAIWYARRDAVEDCLSAVTACTLDAARSAARSASEEKP